MRGTEGLDTIILIRCIINGLKKQKRGVMDKNANNCEHIDPCDLRCRNY